MFSNRGIHTSPSMHPNATMAVKRKLNEHDVPEPSSPEISEQSVASDDHEDEPVASPSTAEAAGAASKPIAASKKSKKASPKPITASFADYDLEPRLLRGIRDLRWSSPTSVQAQCIPLALQGRDILARSSTGTGKTGAYLLPILHNHLRRKGQTTLVLVPTKELAGQIAKVAKALAAHCGQDIRIHNIASKESDVVTRAKLAEKPEIVIATPAKASANINMGTLEVKDLAHLVVDEGDLVMG
jgi:ATP-dependent RNA helicase DDX56/DBP9